MTDTMTERDHIRLALALALCDELAVGPHDELRHDFGDLGLETVQQLATRLATSPHVDVMVDGLKGRAWQRGFLTGSRTTVRSRDRSR